jgi:hypothetical protein
VQAEALTRELHSIIQNDRYPLSPTHPGAEGDPKQAAAGAGTTGAAPAAALRAAQQGQVQETRLIGLRDANQWHMVPTPKIAA